jgi:hypothetical protein
LKKVAFLITLILFTSIPAPTNGTISQLPQDIKARLTNYLQRISEGWDQEAVDAANQILSNTSYVSEAWEDFFEEYFSNNPFTDELRFYLGYPVFWCLARKLASTFKMAL